MKTVLIYFAHYSNPRLGTFGRNVATSLVGNPYFTDMADAAANISTAADEFTEAQADAATGTPEAKAIFRVKRKALLKVLREGALHVNLIADGDEVKLRTTAYPLAKDPVATGGPDKALAVTLKPGIGHGSLKMRVKRIKGAHSYLFQITGAPATKDSIWTSIHISRASYVFTGLESGHQYVVRVAGVGSNPNLVFSDEVSSYVL